MEKQIKKGLSLMLAVLMVLSCWVWVAPTKADAASSVYTVTFNVKVNNADDGGDPDWARIFYMPNNGTGTETYTTASEITFDFSNTTSASRDYSISVPGWPSAIYFETNAASATDTEVVISNIRINERTVVDGTWTVGDSGTTNTARRWFIPDSASGGSATSGKVSPNVDRSGAVAEGVWNWPRPNIAQFPEDYDFDKDRYSFRNISDSVPINIYQDIYGHEKGEAIYNRYESRKGSHGLCYGMAVTTASLLLDVPHVDSFIRYVGPCEHISDINKGTKCFELDAITAKTFVKYGYATQYSTQAQFQEYMEDCQDIYNAVYDYVYNGGAPVTIGLREFTYNETKKEWTQSFGHEVLAVGLSGYNGIIVDDSNRDSKRTIYLTRDSNGNFTNEWTYTEYSETTNGTNSFDSSVGVARVIGYNNAIVLPYLVLAGNAQLDTYPNIAEEDENDATTCRVNVIDEEYNLVSVTSNEYDITSNDGYLLPIGEPIMGSNTADYESDMYWTNNTASVTVSDFVGEENEVMIAGNEIAITAMVCEDSVVDMAINENSNIVDFNILSVEGEEYSITIDSSSKDREDIELCVSGIAKDNKITAAQTEEGIVVRGISDGTVTLSKDDEVIATQTITNATSDIEITYDKTGAGEEIELDYEQPHTHSDEDANGKCDDCGEITDAVKNCDCLCHDNELFKFIYMIVSWVLSLFGIDVNCNCGVSYC